MFLSMIMIGLLTTLSAQSNVQPACSSKRRVKRPLRFNAAGNPAHCRHVACEATLREAPMLDRQKVETILSRRFPHATRDQVAVSANAIMGLNEEWEEVPCHDFSVLAALCADGQEVRVLRRRAV
jgi:hypothetical protein